ncbi:MAG: DUF2065 domain-containing protein [Halorhodospira sp.]
MAVGDLLTALALMMVLEGILPAASPDALRRAFRQAAEMDDRALRTAGLLSMGLGALLLYGVRG